MVVIVENENKVVENENKVVEVAIVSKSYSVENNDKSVEEGASEGSSSGYRSEYEESGKQKKSK